MVFTNKLAKFKISSVKYNSLASTLEINYNTNLFGESVDLENITNLFSILNSNEETELIQNFEKFNNKKIISEYLKILNNLLYFLEFC